VQRETVRYWAKISAYSVGQVLIYHVGILFSLFVLVMIRSNVLQTPIYFIFYLLPLQATLIRRGRQAFLVTAVISLSLLLLFRLYMASSLIQGMEEMAIRTPENPLFSGVGSVVTPLIAIELLTLAALVGGLIFVDFYREPGWRTIYRLLGATGGASAVGVVLVLILGGNSEFIASLERMFAEVMRYFRDMMAEVSEAQSAEPAPAVTPMTRDLLMKGFWHYVLSGFMFGYFINLSITVYLGRLWEARTFGAGQRLPRLKEFSIPEAFVWPLIACWAVVLLGRFQDLRGIEIVALNGGLILLFLYGLQGIGILRHLVDKHGLRRRFNMIAILVVILMLIFPPLAILLLVLVPGLGVSEIWIKFRQTRKE